MPARISGSLPLSMSERIASLLVTAASLRRVTHRSIRGFHPRFSLYFLPAFLTHSFFPLSLISIFLLSIFGSPRIIYGR